MASRGREELMEKRAAMPEISMLNWQSMPNKCVKVTPGGIRVNVRQEIL